MTKIIGLTGGIGSGKSTIVNHIKSKGIPVYVADDEAKIILDHPQIKSYLRSFFGDGIFENDRLIRKRLAALVFTDAEKLKKLNSVVHPAVREHFKEWLKKHKDEPLVVKEAAILFESGSNEDCDLVINIAAPEELRISRVMARDKVSRNEVESRMRNQWTEEMRAKKSDFTIENIDKIKAFTAIDEILKKIVNH